MHVSELGGRGMRSGTFRWVALGAMVVVLASAGIAHAVSGGGYSPSEQDCPNDADAYNAGRPSSDPNSPPAKEPAAVPGCHNFKLNVEDGSGHRYAEFGIDQIPNGSGENAHSGSFEVNTNEGGPQVGSAFDTHYQPIPPDGPDEFGLAFYPAEVALCLAGGAAPDSCVFKPTPPDPNSPPTVDPSVKGGTPDGSAAGMAQEFHIYLGADDNLDTGEHDGVDASPSTNTKDSANGPSDGGAVVVNWHPLALVDLVTALASGDVPTAASILSNPVAVADAGGGMCADGICVSAQTTKRVVYKGGSPGERDVYNYDGKVWDPEECSSGSYKDEQA